MKCRLLAASLLCSASLLAQNFNESKKDLDMAQAQYDAANNRVEELKNKIDTGQQRTNSVSGKAEYADDMERQKEIVRKTMAEHNMAVEQCKVALEKLQEVITRVGKEHTVTTANNKFTLMEKEEKPLEPIVRQTPSTVTETQMMVKTNGNMQ